MLDRVAAGEHAIITRSGEPVAQLLPLRAGVPVEALIERWKHLPPVDPEQLRRDIDAIIDQSL